MTSERNCDRDRVDETTAGYPLVILTKFGGSGFVTVQDHRHDSTELIPSGQYPLYATVQTSLYSRSIASMSRGRQTSPCKACKENLFFQGGRQRRRLNLSLGANKGG